MTHSIKNETASQYNLELAKLPDALVVCPSCSNVPNKCLTLEEQEQALKLISDELIVSAALKIASRGLAQGIQVGSISSMVSFLQVSYAALDKESFGIVFLSTNHKIISTEILSTGTLNGASVYPREVLKAVLEHNAHAVILFHNHPSGEVRPSNDDIQITQRLKEALKLISVSILDHIILSPESSYSFAAFGEL